MIDSLSLVENKQGEGTSYLLKYDCLSSKNIKKIKVGFPTDKVASIDYVINFYETDTNGRKKLVEQKNLNNRKVVSKKLRAFGNINETVGVLEYTTDICLEESFNLTASCVEMKITAQRDGNGKVVQVVPTSFDLYEFTQKQEPHIADFDDSSWEIVGLPHCYNDMNTYLNVPGNEDHVWRGNAWYRKHLFVDKKYNKKRFLIEFQSVDVGAAVYVNGVFQKGNSKIDHPEPVTHVGGFHPFVLDITDALQLGKDNVISVKIGNSQNSFFTWPEIGTCAFFGMGLGGINGNVYLHVVDPVHIPLNLDSKEAEWGTYVATKEASDEKAVIKVMTNVRNADMKDRDRIKLVTKVVNEKGKTVLSHTDMLDLKANSCSVVENLFEIEKPVLWYPNNSPYGTPYLYNVVNEIYDGKTKVDEFVTPLGIRTVEWDDNYCYINEKKHFLKGFGYRNMYPALGGAVPVELQWRDIELMAKSGANTLRVGHSPATLEMVNACNVYGIMLILNTNDNEWSLKNEPTISYKREYDKKAIIAHRNAPSVIVWESNNGIARDGDIYWPSYTLDNVNRYDSITPRIVLSRDCYPKHWDPQNRIVIGYTNWYKKIPGSPSLNAEVYGTTWDGAKCHCIARFDYENEVQFSNWYLKDYLSNVRDSACGWIDWMLTETFGEGYTIYLNGMKNQKSLGSCTMDGNRIPKLKYNIFKNAFWYNFETKPGVTLQSSIDLKSSNTIHAWSNCPKVELFVNGESKGIVTPDERIKHCTWEVPWTSGEYKVVGLDANGKKLCTDVRHTSGAPYRVVLSVQEQLRKPDGTQFVLQANGSDAAIIEAKIVDKDGHLCTLADHNIRFEVSDKGVYKGSYNFYVAEDKPINYHAPGDCELQAEGGLIRIAVRTTFKPGKVTVKAYVDGLLEGKADYMVYKVSKP